MAISPVPEERALNWAGSLQSGCFFNLAGDDGVTGLCRAPDGQEAHGSMARLQ